MGIFDRYKNFQKSRSESKASKATRIIQNPKAIKEDRWAALEFLGGYSDIEVGVRGLLKRFDYSLEHGINDTREKELAMKGILQHGKATLPILVEWISQTNRIAWPIKILKELGSEQEIVDALKKALNFGEVSFDQAIVDKNYDILCYLRDYNLGEFANELGHFLKDPDERVRYSCVETLIEQKSQSVPKLLEPFISDESAENTRLRQSVIQAFITNHWKIENKDQFESERVAPGVRLKQDGTLEGQYIHEH